MSEHVELCIACDEELIGEDEVEDGICEDCLITTMSAE